LLPPKEATHYASRITRKPAAAKNPCTWNDRHRLTGERPTIVRFPTHAATDQDRAGLFSSLVAYTGRYRIDGDKWITRVDVSANPAWVDTEQTRSFRIDGDRLQESTQWAARPEKGMARGVLTYERAK